MKEKSLMPFRRGRMSLRRKSEQRLNFDVDLFSKKDQIEEFDPLSGIRTLVSRSDLGTPDHYEDYEIQVLQKTNPQLLNPSSAVLSRNPLSSLDALAYQLDLTSSIAQKMQDAADYENAIMEYQQKMAAAAAQQKKDDVKPQNSDNNE